VSADLYQRPSRDAIAARVNGNQRAQEAAAAAVTERQPASDVVALFAVHVRARLSARGWTLSDLSGRTGDSTGNLAQAIKGSKCPLAIAGRIAGAFGVPLAEMLVPYRCRTCAGYDGKPPAGCKCLECGDETRLA